LGNNAVAVIREEFADDFYTSSLSTIQSEHHPIGGFRRQWADRFASGHDLEAETNRSFGGEFLDVFETWSFLDIFPKHFPLGRFLAVFPGQPPLACFLDR
jgi:hypothetical protein